MTITPGPWKLKFEPVGNPVDHSDYPFAHFLAGKDDEWDEVSNTGFHLAGIMNEDDARCMVAAPELLAFAKYVLEMDPASEARLFVKARAAIAKAEGKS